MKYLYGSIAIIIGALLLIKTEWFYNWTGPIDWAESHLGAEGGTRLFFKLIGLIIIFGTFLVLTGILPKLLGGIFKSSSLTL